MMKETCIHVRQCLALPDEVQDWFMHTVFDTMRTLGMSKLQDIHSVGSSKHVTALLAASPLFRLHALLRHTYWGGVQWLEQQLVFPRGTLIADVVNKWRSTGVPLVSADAPDASPEATTLQASE